MAYWEVVQPKDSCVIAVPGCNVWRDEWTELCRGKHVTLWFDSDHPRVVGGRSLRAGYDGMVRVAKRLAGIAASVRWLRWGPEGTATGKPKKGFLARIKQADESLPFDDVATIAMTWELSGTGLLYDGIVDLW